MLPTRSNPSNVGPVHVGRAAECGICQARRRERDAAATSAPELHDRAQELRAQREAPQAPPHPGAAGAAPGAAGAGTPPEPRGSAASSWP